MTLSADAELPSAPLTSAAAVRRRRAGVLALALLAVVLAVLACAAPTDSPAPGGTQSPGATPTPGGTPAPGVTQSPGGSPGASPTAAPTPVATLAPGQSFVPDASPVPGCPLPPPAGMPTYPPGHPQQNAPLPHPLCPAQVTGDPVSFLAWLFTPIFQVLFMGLVAFYELTGDIGIAIILLTIAIKTLLIPLFRRQIVAQRRMQLLQPEIRAIQQKFKGNRTKISEETMRLYQERGVNPAAGCLPMLLQLFLLLPIYQVVSQGLAATDISFMLQVFGQPVMDVSCQNPGSFEPCIDTSIWWLGGLEAHVKSVLFTVPGIGFEVSGLAFIAAFLQLIQTRMMTPSTDDPQARAQQRILLVLPLLVLFWGFLPAGLFLYWIVFSAYSIVQQYFIAGWGSLFPLFGWTPGFAKDHTPRFAVDISPRRPASASEREQKPADRSPSDSAAGTIRQNRQRGRTSRRGRRR